MKDRPPFAYALAALTFLAVVSYTAIRVYDNMIGQIYYGPLQGFFASALRFGAESSVSYRAKAAIFYSDATASSFKDPEKYGSLVVAWRRTLAGQRIANDVVDGRGLVGGKLSGCSLLVLPFATHLSDDEIDAIKRFVGQEGNGLILAGAAGSHRENGDWREISLAAEIIGGEAITEVEPREGGSAHMLLDGKSPLSANIPPGLRIGVNMYDRPVSARILEQRSHAAGYWEREGQAGYDFSAASASVVSGSYGKGRFVWTGFTLGSPVDPFGVKAGEILVRNMAAYAAGRPIFGKEPWPGSKQAAVVFAIEAEDLQDAAAAAALFSAARVPCTFFTTPADAQAQPEAFKRIAAHPSFELGLRGSADYLEQPLEVQAELLSGAKSALERLAGRKVLGFSPAQALYDGETVQALLGTGFSYLAGDAVSWGPPSVLQARKPRLLRIGRDLRLLIKFPHAERARKDLVFERLKADFDAAYRIGGFQNFSLSSSLARDKAMIQELAKFLDYVKTKNVWLASLSEAADWSNEWMLVDVDSANTSEIRSNLLVTNNSPTEIASLRLNMHHPGDGSITAKAEKLGGSINVIAQQKGKALLEIRSLRGEGIVYFVDRGKAIAR